MKEDEKQQKYIELKMLDHQIKELQNHLEQIEAQGTELDQISESLEILKAEEKGKDILVPVANGIFLKANIKESDKVIINVGSNVAVEKDLSTAKTLVEAQRGQLTVIESEVTHNLQEMIEKAIDLQSQLKD